MSGPDPEGDGERHSPTPLGYSWAFGAGVWFASWQRRRQSGVLTEQSSVSADASATRPAFRSSRIFGGFQRGAPPNVRDARSVHSSAALRFPARSYAKMISS